MTVVVAIYQDGRRLHWHDGEIGGDRILAHYLEHPPVPTAPVTPEGPVKELADYRRDPWAFVAAAKVIRPDDHAPRFSMELMPGLSAVR